MSKRKSITPAIDTHTGEPTMTSWAISQVANREHRYLKNLTEKHTDFLATIGPKPVIRLQVSGGNPISRSARRSSLIWRALSTDRQSQTRGRSSLHAFRRSAQGDKTGHKQLTK